MSFSARSNGSPFPAQGDPFENILSYSEAYIGLKKISRLVYMADRDNEYSRHAFLEALNYSNNKHIPAYIADLKQINAKHQFHFDDMLKDTVKPHNDEIIETTGASLQGETGKLDLENRAEYFANKHEYNKAVAALVQSRQYGNTDKDRGLTQLKICSLVSIFGDGKSLLNHSQYNKGLVELKNQSLEIYHGLNVCYALSKIITPCKLEEYKRNLKDASRILKDVILSRRYKEEVMPFNHVIIYFVISSICGSSREELLSEIVNNPSVMKIIRESYPNLKVLLNSIAQCDYKTYRLSWIKMNRFIENDYILRFTNVTIVGLFKKASLEQYFKPYKIIKLSSMAEEFGDNLGNLQKEMSNLIITGIIDGKIDEENQCLYLKKGVNTNQIIMQSYNTVNNSIYDQKANIFRIKLYERQLELQRDENIKARKEIKKKREEENRRPYNRINPQMYGRGGMGGYGPEYDDDYDYEDDYPHHHDYTSGYRASSSHDHLDPRRSEHFDRRP